MRFTDKYIDSLKPSDKINDVREANGFGIRVLPSGVKTWFFIYRIDGKRRFMNLGHYPSITLAEARKKYRAAYDLYEHGKDPARLAERAKEERRKAPTVADLCAEYLERHAKPNKRSWAKDEEILKRDVIPAWGNRKAEDITKRDVIDLLEKIVDRGAPAMANYCFAIIRKMFNFAVDRDVLQSSPVSRIKLPAPKQSRDRTLTEAEIRTFWAQLEDCAMSDEVRRALKLILVTAQRPGEVVGMHSSEIDGHWWTIPAERAKNGKAHRVYLTATALELIGDSSREGYIFPTPSPKKNQAIAPQALIVALSRNRAGNGLKIDHFSPHDLRRTAATFMAEAREMDEVIDAVLNHAKQGIIKVYNQYRYDREKQAALEAWERKLTSIVTGKPLGKVLTMQRVMAE